MLMNIFITNWSIAFFIFYRLNIFPFSINSGIIYLEFFFVNLINKSFYPLLFIHTKLHTAHTHTPIRVVLRTGLVYINLFIIFQSTERRRKEGCLLLYRHTKSHTLSSSSIVCVCVYVRAHTYLHACSCGLKCVWQTASPFHASVFN